MTTPDTGPQTSRLDVGTFTAGDIQTMARAVDLPVEKVRRLTELAVFVGRLPRADDPATDLLRAVVEEVEAEEKRWLEWWARGGKGAFVWKRDAVRAARAALARQEGA